MDGIVLLLIFVGFPVGVAICCGRFQRRLVREDSAFAKVLPVVTGFMALGGVGLAMAGGLDGIFGGAVSVGAFLGTLIGWLRGRSDQNEKKE